MKSVELCLIFYVQMGDSDRNQGPDSKQVSNSNWVIRREFNNGLLTKGRAFEK